MDIKIPSKSHVIELRNGLSPNDNECRKYKNLPHVPEYKLLINQSYSKQVKRVNKKKAGVCRLRYANTRLFQVIHSSVVMNE